jgi:hypothetical protein
MSAILGWIKNRGIHTGLQQTGNSFKMAAYILAPFLVVWFVIKLIVPMEYNDTASMVAFVGWIAYIIMLYAKAKSDAAGYIPFPQSHWFFPDGQQISFDLLVPPNGWEKVVEYPDGSMLYRVNFKDKCAVQEADRPYPDIFDHALWKVPCEWNVAFKRNSHGEFFFENLFIDHPACENIEVGVIDWDEQGSTRLPVCVITGSSWYYEESRKTGGKLLPNPALRTTGKEKRLEAVIVDLKEENRELTSRNRFLESEAEQYTKKEPRDIKELSDKRLSRIREEVGDIMDTEQSWRERILNFRTLAIVVAVLVVLVVMSHFIIGWP